MPMLVAVCYFFEPHGVGCLLCQANAGTPQYMAPELLQPGKPYSSKVKPATVVTSRIYMGNQSSFQGRRHLNPVHFTVHKLGWVSGAAARVPPAAVCFLSIFGTHAQIITV
jgi:hypothetical protein